MNAHAGVMGPLASAPLLRTYAFGRSALHAALQLCDLKEGDAVLLPGYICQEVLAPVAASAARAVYYEVNEVLEPAPAWHEWPAARAVVAVNYFGFPQALAPFRAYCAHYDAVLIEDNAHGWLSRDADGNWLGLRGDLGIFSMRKTLRLTDGAALAVMRADLAARVPAQLPAHQASMPVSQQVERWLAHLPSATPLVWARAMRRSLRTWRTGTPLPPPDLLAETRMPPQAAPHAGLQAALDAFDAAAETARRRKLYAQIHACLAPFGVVAVWPQLPAGVVPYCYAFRARAQTGCESFAALDAVRRMGLDVFPWPALPSAIAPGAPPHYTHTWLVNLL